MVGLAPPNGYRDDVALLVYRHPAPLDITFPADANHLAPTRAALREWLAAVGIDQEKAQEVLVAAGEAVTNAIEHGHRNEHDGTINLRATSVADQLQLTVTDTGSWKPEQSAGNSHRGRGIAIMRAFMEEVSILPDTAGTTVRMATRIC